MPENIESYFKPDANTEIFYQIWSCPQPIATVFLTHGMGEHSGCYEKFARDLNKHKIQVFAWDLRGHGRSSGQRGFVNNFKEHCLDLKKTYKYFLKENISADHPIVLLGHSMGGTITLRSYIEQRPKEPKMICLSSPALGIKNEPGVVKEKLAQIANKYLPRLSMSSEIKHELLSQDPEQLNFYKQDNLRHNKINARTYMGMKESFAIIFKKINKIKLPILFLTSEPDGIVDSAKTQELYQCLENENKCMNLYENSMHEVFNDIEREQVIEDLVSFINNNLS